MGAMSREKGKRGELEFAHFCQSAGFDVRRSAQYRGNTGAAGDCEGLPGVHIEVKRVEHLNLLAAYLQSYRDAAAGGAGATPIVAHRCNRSPWLVTMSAADWLAMYKASRADGGLWPDSRADEPRADDSRAGFVASEPRWPTRERHWQTRRAVIRWLETADIEQGGLDNGRNRIDGGAGRGRDKRLD